MNGCKAVTLLELIIVVTIIGILSTLGVGQWLAARERALDNEARANLRIIIAAGRIDRLESSTGTYTAYGTTGTLNSGLHLVLPATKWTYLTTVNTTPTPPVYCAQATRVTTGRTWRLRSTEQNPVRDGTCP